MLAYFAEAWPWAELGEHTAEVWADALVGVDGQQAHSAARRLVRSEERPPSIRRFIDECKLVAREQRPALQAPTSSATDRRQAARRIGAIRAEFAAHDRPDHNHRHGPDQCPRCATSARFVAETSDAILDAFKEQP